MADTIHLNDSHKPHNQGHIQTENLESPQAPLSEEFLYYDNQGKIGIVISSSVSDLNKKRINSAIKEIADAGCDITDRQILFFTQQPQTANYNALFLAGGKRFHKTRYGIESVYFDPSISLGNRLSDPNLIIVHEYGHFVDWCLGGRKEGLKDGKLVGSYFMSDSLFPSLGYTIDPHEPFASLFVMYVLKRPDSFMFLPSRTKAQYNQLITEFKRAMKALPAWRPETAQDYITGPHVE